MIDNENSGSRQSEQETLPTKDIPELTITLMAPAPESEAELKPRRKPPLQRGISRNKSENNILPVTQMSKSLN